MSAIRVQSTSVVKKVDVTKALPSSYLYSRSRKEMNTDSLYVTSVWEARMGSVSPGMWEIKISPTQNKLITCLKL